MVVSNPEMTMKTSGQWAQRRMRKAISVLGAEVPERILAFAWYLQGVETQDIAQALSVPVDTVNGLFKRLFRDGLPALEDRRRSTSTFLPPPPVTEAPLAAQIGLDAEQIEVSVNSMHLRLNRNDPLQCRLILLVLLDNGCVETAAVADALGLSVERLRKLRAEFRRGGALALVDQRRGQTQDYAMPPEVKAELIRHYVEKIEAGGPVSAPSLKAAIEASGKSSPSPRTLRLHVKKLGLDHIRADHGKPAMLKKGLRTT